MITSVQNERVKKWRRLQGKKGRSQASMFIVEGFHLVEEACKSDYEIIEIVVQSNIQIPEFCEQHTITQVSEQVFKQIAQTKTPQGIAAIVAIGSINQEIGDYVLLIDGIQDPGNLGTIIRTADAVGFSTVVLGEGTVDLYNDKVIRATQGSLFHIRTIEANLVSKINMLKEANFSVWATGLTNATSYNEMKRKGKTALILGNEGAGIQDELLQLADEIVNIPIYGKAESLNVSVAAGILMYYIKG